MDKILLRKRVRAAAARLGVLRPLRKLVFRLRGGGAENPELGFLSHFIRPESHVFDVGANRGQSSENYIQLGARVTAFEPQEDLHPEIRQLCRNSPKLVIESCGLGSAEETRRFFITAYDQVASLREDWVGEHIGEKTINISTLDRQIERHGMPHYCKIDVEGWELEVLKGLTQTIPIISFEYHLSSEETVKARDVLKRISELGDYSCNIRRSMDQDFLLENFLPIEEFTSAFPDEYLPTPHEGYGDIFCVIDPSLIVKP